MLQVSQISGFLSLLQKNGRLFWGESTHTCVFLMNLYHVPKAMWRMQFHYVFLGGNGITETIIRDVCINKIPFWKKAFSSLCWCPPRNQIGWIFLNITYLFKWQKAFHRYRLLNCHSGLVEVDSMCVLSQSSCWYTYSFFCFPYSSEIREANPHKTGGNIKAKHWGFLWFYLKSLLYHFKGL